MKPADRNNAIVSGSVIPLSEIFTLSAIFSDRLSDDDSIKWMTDPFMDVSDMFMFDTTGAGYGGTGKKFDWNMLKGHDIGKPFFLSGGIQPDDIHALKEFAAEPVAKELFAIDINSKFESSPGVKEMDKVGKFIRELTLATNT